MSFTLGEPLPPRDDHVRMSTPEGGHICSLSLIVFLSQGRQCLALKMERHGGLGKPRPRRAVSTSSWVSQVLRASYRPGLGRPLVEACVAERSPCLRPADAWPAGGCAWPRGDAVSQPKNGRGLLPILGEAQELRLRRRAYRRRSCLIRLPCRAVRVRELGGVRDQSRPTHLHGHVSRTAGD